MGYLLLFDQLNEQRQEMINKNMQIARLTANYVDDYLSSYKQTLKGVAFRVPLIDNDRNELTKLLRDISLAHSEASLFYVANAKGQLLAKYPNDHADKNIVDRDFFTAAMQKKVFIGGPYVGRVTGIDIISITAPFYQDGKVSGIVGVSIPLDELQNKLSVIQIGHSGYATRFTKDGNFLWHPKLEELKKTMELDKTPLFKAALAAKTGEGSIGPSPGEEPPEQHSFVTLTEAPWVIVIVQPLQEFNNQMNQIMWRNIFIIILLIMFIIVILRYFNLLKDRIAAEHIQKAEKLALVGQLAAGVAHEIRNPLTSIKGFVQLIQSKKSEPIPEFYLETIMQEIDRINDIVGEMVVLAKPVPVQFAEINLRNLINDILNLIGPQAVLKDIQLELIASEDLLAIRGEPNQLKQVFINLIKNSIESIVDGGFVKIHLTNRGNSVVEVKVQDNGPGVPRENLEKLGTPFFTTKETGTGLGLMVTYGIIRNHKGEINVLSEVGHGTTFSINFPVLTIE
ncbi:PAS domain-containing sensor histidine kinase [Desulfosporosinus sp. OT]|uniref:PAS domain-containing sensor histidine kinase n=1 Tax=Desulfosporosinus sp. OT TaxID=913865 RepID=UPI001300C961|nr:PAS domain-containing sensor histidine kinase [Desulfosporosinus sp. OT]